MLYGVPRNHIYKIIRTGQVRVNRKRAKAHQRLQAGDVLRIPPVRLEQRSMPKSVSSDLKNATRLVIFEDRDLIAIDKPTGIAVHAGTNHRAGLIEAMRLERPDLEYVELVHRLDKQTSGILLLAKNRRTLTEMHAMLRCDPQHSRSLAKYYHALLKGQWTGGVRELRSGHSGADEGSTAKRTPKKISISTFRPIRIFDDCTLIDIALHTGKTHQARQHALEAGHPIVGDGIYGDRRFNSEMRRRGLNRMFLHAYRVTFTHPGSGEAITLDSVMPPELQRVIENMNGAIGVNG